MKVGELFSSFDSKLKISQDRRILIASRRNLIVKRLNQEFRGYYSNCNSLFVGSYGRNTANEFVSDIDLVCILPYETYQRFNQYVNNGQSALLQAVKQAIAKTYPCTSLKGDGQIVDVTFSDGMKFEILPSFENNDGRSLIYANSNDGGSWQVTDPRPEIKAFQDMNKECNDNLYSLCRMVRAWKYTNNVDIKSCLLDLFAYLFLNSYEYKDNSYVYYDWMLRDYFEYLSKIDDNQHKWMMPGSRKMYFCFDNFQAKARKAYEIAKEAIEYDDVGCEWSAKQRWKSILGNNFAC